MVKQLVENDKQYWDFIRELRNHPGVKAGFVEQEHIDRFDHALYMQRFGSYFYLCLLDGEPAGFVGVVKDDIRVATHPNFQKMGVASFMIRELMKMHPTAFAKVKVENEASIRLFERCGFKKKYYILEKQ